MPMRKYRRKQRKYKKRTARQLASKGIFKAGTTTLQKELIVADRSVVKLRYLNVDNPQIPANALLPYSTITLIANGLWDVSPLVASSAIPGFSEWGNFYESYRAISIHIKATFVNNLNFPQYCFIYVPGRSAPTPVSWTDFRQTKGNQYCKMALMQATGNNGTTRTLSMFVPFADLIGNKQLYRSNLNYEGQTAGGVASGNNPGIPINLICGILSLNGSGTVTNPTTMDLQLTWNVEFYNRLPAFSP